MTDKSETFDGDLRECILFLLNFHQGRAQMISRSELLHQLAAHGFAGVSDRRVRDIISDLKQGGELIASTGGIDGGYCIATNWNELEEYWEHEVDSRALNLLQQKKAQRHQAVVQFGPKPVPGQMEMELNAAPAA
jgi:hypothetical protein